MMAPQSYSLSYPTSLSADSKVPDQTEQILCKIVFVGEPGYTVVPSSGIQYKSKQTTYANNKLHFQCLLNKLAHRDNRPTNYIAVI